jgi:uncharacterized protein with HEPN domain
MSLDELAYIKHMLDEARYLAGTAANLEQTDFLADPTLQRAFVRSLEIMGEAAKHVPEPFRTRHPFIPWRAMAGMRDRMIHDYLGVDYGIVWDVVKNKAPALRIDLERILELESPRGAPDSR